MQTQQSLTLRALIWAWIKAELAMILAIIVIGIFGILFLRKNDGSAEEVRTVAKKIDAFSDRLHADITKAAIGIDTTLKAEGIETREIAKKTQDEVGGIHSTLSDVSSGLENMNTANESRLQRLEKSDSDAREARERAEAEAKAKAEAAAETAAALARSEAEAKARSTAIAAAPRESPLRDDSHWEDRSEGAVASPLPPVTKPIRGGTWLRDLTVNDMRRITWISNRNLVIARVYYRPGFFRRSIDMTLPIRTFPEGTESIDLFAKDTVAVTW